MTIDSPLFLRASWLIFVAALAPLLAAQDFGPRQELTASIDDVNGTVTGDFNGDGSLDIVLATELEVLLFPGGPMGQFQPRVTVLESTDEVRNLHAADLDGDGDLDLLFSTSSPSRIRWSENLGGGQFASDEVIDFTGFSIQGSLRTADVDGDGDLDIYSWTIVNNRNFWIANLGGGDFGQVTLLTGPDSYSSWLDAGDVDGDGDLDFVGAMNSDKAIALWENLGAGVFAPRLDLAATAESQAFLELADLNGDGRLDILTLRNSAFGGTAEVYLGDGTGSFGAPTLIDHQIPFNSRGELGDLDGDGRLDLVLGTADDTPLAWLKNTSSGSMVSFSSPTAIAERAYGTTAFPLGDLDGNGTLDVVFASDNQKKLAWYPGDGAGSFGQENELTGSAANALQALPVDFDGDGDLDVVSLSFNDRKIALYEGLGGGLFGPQEILTLLAPDPSYLATGDLDGDGDPDLLLAVESSQDLTWYPNLGNGQIGPAVVISAGVSTVEAMHVADLDGDGILDVLIAMSPPGGIRWIPGLPGGNFGTGQTLVSTTIYFGSVTSADLDADGDLDVLYSASGFTSDEEVAWIENLGAGVFGPSVQLLPFFDARGVLAVDVDLDGLDDLIVCGQGTSSLLNNPAGGFGSTQVVSNGFSHRVDATDIDGDADPDLLLVRNHRLVWHRRGQGGGWSQANVIEQDLVGPRDAVFADLDGDGDPDVLAAGGFAGTVQWYENLIDPGIGVADCAPAVPNSTNLPGTLTGIGSPWVPNNALVLTANDLPPNQVGLFLASPNAGFVAGPGGSQGNLCLAAPIGRFNQPGQVQSSGPGGTLSLAVDLTQVPSPAGSVPVLMGEQWHFQLWHRDLNPGPTSNFTNALVIEFQ